jgi:hypothetical protein
MKPSAPQKSISLLTALFAASTGIAFFWASLLSPSESRQPSSTSAHPAQTAQQTPRALNKPALRRNEVQVAALSVRNALRNLNQVSRKEQARFDNFDCLSTTALEDSNGQLVGTWPSMPTGVHRCLIRAVKPINKLPQYVVILEWQDSAGLHHIAEAAIIR